MQQGIQLRNVVDVGQILTPDWEAANGSSLLNNIVLWNSEMSYLLTHIDRLENWCAECLIAAKFQDNRIDKEWAHLCGGVASCRYSRRFSRKAEKFFFRLGSITWSQANSTPEKEFFETWSSRESSVWLLLPYKTKEGLVFKKINELLRGFLWITPFKSILSG